jgi:multidrug transporter EmrE-like cation transporter
MGTKPLAIIAIALCTILTSFAQVFYKKGANLLQLNILSILTNYNLLFGLILYGLALVIMILSFKHGEVTVLYPIIALGYIWVSLLSIYFFNETMNFYKWLGVLIIISGVITITYGSQGKDVEFVEVA